MKLVQINVDALNGSNSSIAKDISSMARARGWENYLAYGRDALPCDAELIKIGNIFDIRLHGLLTRLFDAHGLGSIISTKRFIKKLEKIQPDIVHLHNIHGYFLNYKILFQYLIKNQIPVVWTFHDCWPFTGHCGHFESVACDRWISLCYDCPLRGKYPSSWFMDRSKQNYILKKKLFTSVPFMTISTVSNWLKGLVGQSYFKKYDIEIVYDGIDTNVFRPRESMLRKDYGLENKVVLLAAAFTWSKSKGWDDYITLSKKLKEDHVIVLLGVDMEAQKTLPDNVIGIPRVTSKEVLSQWFSMADILLNLSYQETFGMTTAEALACGTPGISYNRTACPEVLSADTGVVVEAGNIPQILKAIETIVTNGKDYYRENCRKRVLNNFDSKVVNLKFFDIYEQLLNAKK